VVADNHPALVRGRRDFKLLAASVNPDSQLNEVFYGQLLDGMFDFLNLAHVKTVHLTTSSMQALHGPVGRLVGLTRH